MDTLATRRASVALVALLGACHSLVPLSSPANDGTTPSHGDASANTDAHPVGADASSSAPWVAIKAGSFTMGSPPTEPCRQSDEQQHTVTLTHNFLMQRTEVTQSEFTALMSYNPSVLADCGPECPVENVNWHVAAAYCNALSEKNGQMPCYACSGSNQDVECQPDPTHAGTSIYDCPGYRLPTEAEWEYAYRAATTSATYAGALEVETQPDDCATCATIVIPAASIGWYCANANDGSQPGGSRAPNDWSLLDMAGNVAEWCHDAYQSDLGPDAVIDPVVRPVDVLLLADRVVRGGSWETGAGALRAADREPIQPSGTSRGIGFRCVRSVELNPD